MVREIYAESWRLLREVWPAMVSFSVLVVGLETWLDSDGGNFASSAILTGGFAYLCHRYLLLGERPTLLRAPPPEVPPRLGRFMVIIFAYLALIVTVSIVVALNIPAGRSGGAFMLYAVLILLPLMAIVLSAFGTVFPAAAIEEDFRIGRAILRGRGQFWRIMAGLICGPGVVGALLLVALSLLLGDDHEPRLMAFVIDTAIEALSLVPTAMAVVVLCLAYRRAEPAPQTPA